MKEHTTKRVRMSWKDVWARRLARHCLAAPAQDAEPADVVAAMCGAHAQVMSAAEISVALRMAGATRQDVRNALWREHSLVKTFGPRGTVHLLPTRDLPMWTGAFSALPAGRDGLPEEARMTPEQTEIVVEAIAAVLADAALTVDEMDEAIVDIAGSWVGDLVVPAWYEMIPRWRPAIYTAAARGVLCYGPNRKRTVTYTNPQRWMPGFKRQEGWQALHELALNYLYAYGPATPQQFARWLARPIGWAMQLFDSLGAEIEEVDVEGFAAWVAAGDVEMTSNSSRNVRLLPYFDAFVVGSQPREQLFPGKAAERALSNGQAGNFPVLLLHDVVGGVWHQRRSGRTIHFTVEPFNALNGRQPRQLEEQVERVAQILEGRPELTIGAVKVGPHA